MNALQTLRNRLEPHLFRVIVVQGKSGYAPKSFVDHIKKMSLSRPIKGVFYFHDDTVETYFQRISEARDSILLLYGFSQFLTDKDKNGKRPGSAVCRKINQARDLLAKHKIALLFFLDAGDKQLQQFSNAMPDIFAFLDDVIIVPDAESSDKTPKSPEMFFLATSGYSSLGGDNPVSKRKELKRLRRAFRNRLKQKKVDVNILYQLTKLFRDLGEYAMWENFFRQYVVPFVMDSPTNEDAPYGISERDQFILKNDFAESLYWNGKYEDALGILLQLTTNPPFSSDHSMVAHTFNSLGNVYYSRLQFDKAEELYKRALEIFEKSVTPNHNDIAATLNNLGNLYGAQFRLDEAESCFRRALEIREGACPPYDPRTTYILNNLAGLYMMQGLYEKAKPLSEQVLEAREKTLGSDHPFLARALSNLATIYSKQGSYERADDLYSRSLEIMRRTLSPGHPDFTLVLNNYIEFLRTIGQETKAAKLKEQVGNELSK